MEYNTKLEESKEGIILAKYSIYISKTRNVYTGCSLGLAIVAFSNSTIFDEDNYKPYIKLIGISTLLISTMYGIDNIFDYEKYVYKHNINKKTMLLDDNSINNDILLIKSFLILMIIVVILSSISFFY